GTPLPPPGGELSDPLLGQSLPVGPRWSRSVCRELSLEGPGRRRIAPSRLLVSDPLGLWRRELSSGRIEELVLLPRVEPVSLGSAGADGEGSSNGSNALGAESAARGPSESEVDGLRRYREGSPASRIHWPAVARTGEMIERHLTSGAGSRPLVVFDPRHPGDPTSRQRAMRAAASLCVELGGSGGCDLLLPGERRPLHVDPALRSWPEVHVRLALSNPAAPALIPRGWSGGAVFWVTARPGVPGGLRGIGPGSYVVTPAGSEKEAAFRVAGCSGFSMRSRAAGRPLQMTAAAGR